MIVQKLFSTESLHSHTIRSQQGREQIEVTVIEGGRDIKTYSVPKDRDLESFVDGMFQGIIYQTSEIREIRMKERE